MQIDLSGRTAFVSGSTQGIGRAIAAKLAAAGARVAVNGRDEERTNEVVMQLRDELPGAELESVAADVATTVFTSASGDPETCHALCEALASPERLVSPTRFTNSVHNAPAGYWHIAAQSRCAAAVAAAQDAGDT